MADSNKNRERTANNVSETTTHTDHQLYNGYLLTANGIKSSHGKASKSEGTSTHPHEESVAAGAGIPGDATKEDVPVDIKESKKKPKMVSLRQLVSKYQKKQRARQQARP